VLKGVQVGRREIKNKLVVICGYTLFISRKKFKMFWFRKVSYDALK